MCFYAIKALNTTIKVKIIKNDSYNINSQYLFASWHGKKFLAMQQLLIHNTPKCVLVSPSRDGSAITNWLQKVGYTVERGSSRDQGIYGLLRMIKRLKEGFSLCFVVDGPMGPIYKVKPGITYISQKYQFPIIPLGAAFSSKWILSNSWD